MKIEKLSPSSPEQPSRASEVPLLNQKATRMRVMATLAAGMALSLTSGIGGYFLGTSNHQGERQAASSVEPRSSSTPPKNTPVVHTPSLQINGTSRTVEVFEGYTNNQIEFRDLDAEIIPDEAMKIIIQGVVNGQDLQDLELVRNPQRSIDEELLDQAQMHLENPDAPEDPYFDDLHLGD